MRPQDLDDQFLDAIHEGANPVWHKDRPEYYSRIAQGISGWTSASMGALRDLIREAQRSIHAPRGL
jgi:hypothetical protein